MNPPARAEDHDHTTEPVAGPTLEQLRRADCLFAVDRVPHDAAMTAFKRTARYRQYRWAKQQGIEGFDTHANTRANIDAGRQERIVNGTKLRADDAAAGRNFLSPTIWQVAKQRMAERQPGQTLDAERLQRDLLSSMPMAFNLFGEASCHPESVIALTTLLAPDVPASPAEVGIWFEWSPGRRSHLYTRDRTAFDVAIHAGVGPRTVIGIETKYHEDAKRDRPLSHDQRAFLVGLAESSGVFKPGWEDRVIGTPLQQVWRDHLLALSMRQHPELWSESTRYVLVHPRRNRSFAALAGQYAELLTSTESFRSIPLEDVVDAAFAHGGDTAERFRQRYLW